ncbi:hypothetical protein BDEG_26754 [Batrachochytrium dendrobatidis JEL423]|uniref:Uncharacterized protein n=1 Tax=Batrachochytrium dendrobatidis (strain JEL423) TaxID=403673 RepID=A0A177WTE4_BATDL|nr:hypothetical protein BDEG_26754 [Batrachochytrium dendrobatidis JEL423]
MDIINSNTSNEDQQQPMDQPSPSTPKRSRKRPIDEHGSSISKYDQKQPMDQAGPSASKQSRKQSIDKPGLGIPDKDWQRLIDEINSDTFEDWQELFDIAGLNTPSQVSDPIDQVSPNTFDKDQQPADQPSSGILDQTQQHLMDATDLNIFNKDQQQPIDQSSPSTSSQHQQQPMSESESDNAVSNQVIVLNEQDQRTFNRMKKRLVESKIIRNNKWQEYRRYVDLEFEQWSALAMGKEISGSTYDPNIEEKLRKEYKKLSTRVYGIKQELKIFMKRRGLRFEEPDSDSD